MPHSPPVRGGQPPGQHRQQPWRIADGIAHQLSEVAYDKGDKGI
jgi:hypothetical protein